MTEADGSIGVDTVTTRCDHRAATRVRAVLDRVKRIQALSSTAGQNLAELALITPLLLIMIAAVADFGRVFYAFVVIENAAREGARYAASYYAVDEPDFEQAEARASADALGAGLSNATPNVSSAVGPRGLEVVSTVRHRFSLITGVLGISPFDITGTASMLVLQGGAP